MQERHAISWWDALIVAAAQARQCSILLTEDLQSGQVFDSVRVVDPFASPDKQPHEIVEAHYVAKGHGDA